MKTTATKGIRIAYLQLLNCAKLPERLSKAHAQHYFYYRLFFFTTLLVLSTMLASAQWKTVGNAGFAAGQTNKISLVIGTIDNSLYAAYTDANNDAKAAVMVYNTNSITTQPFSSNSFCAGNTIPVTFTAIGTYNVGNIFTAQLSDLDGSFTSTQNIGTLVGTSSGTIQATLPIALPFYYDAQHFRIRVVANSPSVIGSDNGTEIKIYASTAYYKDADGDGYGDYNNATYTCNGQPAPPGYVSNYTDCNDNDATINSPQTYYLDADGDGFGSTTITMVCSYIIPQGYTTNNLDCNDSNAAINPMTIWVLDADGDGYYSGNPITQCTSPGTGYVIKVNQVLGDCNDNDATVHLPQTYYVDADRDGYGSNTTAMLCSSTAPVGYSTNNTDCNDNDATVHAPQLYYVDADKDGYGSTTTAMLCSSTTPVGYSTNSTDCNDNNAAINPMTVWVLDADGDGYYTGNTVTQCTSPGTGYIIKTNQVAGDCNDNDATIHSPRLYYVDADKDGYGSTTTAMLCSSTAPVGYSTNSTDCNDNNAAINPMTMWVLDADGDGYYIGNAATQCTSPGTGYVIKTNQIAGDCNDNDAAVHSPQTYYVDADKDGYGTGAAVRFCSSTAPVGYSANNTDCNDNDAAVHAPQNYYVDADKDGYGAGAAVQFCSSKAPAGYSANNLDCNDKNASIHPGATDGFDGIDNDCDGQIDEDFFQLSICDASISEGNSGQCYLYFTVSLNWIDLRTITVNYTTQDNTATAGSDYVAKSGTLTFPPGILIQTIAIPINGDKTIEPNETFQVVLSNPYNASLCKSTATGTILNDDFNNYISFKAGGPNATKMGEAPELGVRLSPVPARNELHASLAGFEGKIMLQLADSEGKLVMTKQSSSAQEQQTLDVSKLAAGSYLLVVSDEKGNRKTEKFIVSR